MSMPVPVLIEFFQRFFPRTGLDHLVPGAFEIDDDKFADRRLILANQYPFHPCDSLPAYRSAGSSENIYRIRSIFRSNGPSFV